MLPFRLLTEVVCLIINEPLDLRHSNLCEYKGQIDIIMGNRQSRSGENRRYKISILLKKIGNLN